MQLRELQINSKLNIDDSTLIATGIVHLPYLVKFVWHITDGIPLSHCNNSPELFRPRKIQSQSLQILDCHFSKMILMTSIDCPNLRQFSYDEYSGAIRGLTLLTFFMSEYLFVRLADGRVVPKSEAYVDNESLYGCYDYNDKTTVKLSVPSNCELIERAFCKNEAV
jgi:hypothetical protein